MLARVLLAAVGVLALAATHTPDDRHPREATRPRSLTRTCNHSPPPPTSRSSGQLGRNMDTLRAKAAESGWDLIEVDADQLPPVAATERSKSSIGPDRRKRSLPGHGGQRLRPSAPRCTTSSSLGPRQISGRPTGRFWESRKFRKRAWEKRARRAGFALMADGSPPGRVQNVGKFGWRRSRVSASWISSSLHRLVETPRRPRNLAPRRADDDDSSNVIVVANRVENETSAFSSPAVCMSPILGHHEGRSKPA